MKTWEMIKELTENPGKKFKDKRGRIAYVDTGEIICKPLLDIDEEWELIVKPVDFMTAIKAFNEGKNIYCEYNKHLFCYKADKCGKLIDEYGEPIEAYAILNGKWYIDGDI